MGVVVLPCFILLLSTLFCFGSWTHVEGAPIVANTIVVDINGQGKFRSIQAAINSVPANNNQWIRINVNPGLYQEKVTISTDKPFILLEGHAESATFRVNADNFVARSITFKLCELNVNLVPTPSLKYDYITAQGRMKATDPNGFVFKYCMINGTGKVYLGRPWVGFARVIFYKTIMYDVIIPAGWDPHDADAHVDTLTFVENGCTGAGSNLSGRVKWEKHLTNAELEQFTNLSFS
ncbi:putative pectinesterase 29 [Tasmannia lanceolata]|uniref:putative pectinesterase 29 n=1 Tax=Tasmannia lanceolata TaxID=3420 RepID=UPI004063BC8F